MCNRMKNNKTKSGTHRTTGSAGLASTADGGTAFRAAVVRHVGDARICAEQNQPTMAKSKAQEDGSGMFTVV